LRGGDRRDASAGHALTYSRSPVNMTEFLTIYGRVAREDIRHNRGNVAERLGFLRRIITATTRGLAEGIEKLPRRSCRLRGGLRLTILEKRSEFAERAYRYWKRSRPVSIDFNAETRITCGPEALRWPVSLTVLKPLSRSFVRREMGSTPMCFRHTKRISHPN